MFILQISKSFQILHTCLNTFHIVSNNLFYLTDHYRHNVYFILINSLS